MRRRMPFVVVLAISLLSFSGAWGGHDPEHPPADPVPGTQAWEERDGDNMARSGGRMRDEYTHPAFASTFWPATTATFTENLARQAAQPDRPIVTLAQWIPGGTTADPYRVDWEQQGRGIRIELTFLNRYGAKLRGNLWAPNPGAPDPVTGAPMNPPYPAVVITTGSIQGYQNLYLWAAQALAEAGYVVLTYDVQGQGESETFGHDPDGNIWCNGTSTAMPPPPSPGGVEQNPACPGVPFQQAANFVNGTVDALDYLFSTDADPYAWHRAGSGTSARNPLAAWIDRDRVGLAGHSLGAGAVSIVQAYDTRVKAIVAWDNLSSAPAPRVPAMGQNAEYFFNPQRTASKPASAFETPAACASASVPKDCAFKKWADAGVDAMQVALTGSTHLEWTYVPYILPASADGERVATYYTLAWFDRYIHHDAARRAEALTRLTATVFDDSADASAIGAGAYQDGGNVPYTIAGRLVWKHLSFYWDSHYRLTGDDAVVRTCRDMRRDPAC